MTTATATRTKDKKYLVRRLQIKEVDVEERTFTGLAATWDLDLGGDIIERGAFKKTIRDWRRKKRILPLLDSHNWFSIRDAVGKMTDAEEVEEGLLTSWRIVPGKDGDEVLNRLRPDGKFGAYVDTMSIGYVPLKFEFDDEVDDALGEERVRVLKEVELHEVSLVLFPMNPMARIDSGSVKRLVDDVALLMSHAPRNARGKLRAALTARFRKDQDSAREMVGELGGMLEGISAELEDTPDLEDAAALVSEMTVLAERLQTALEPDDDDDDDEEDGRKPEHGRKSKKKTEAKPKPGHKRMPDDFTVTPPERGEPDMSMFDQLRLRRLGSFRGLTT